MNVTGIGARGVHHVSRSVGDMERSLAFYRDLLGFEVVLDTEMSGRMLELEVGLEGAHLRLVELAAGDGQTMLELLQYLSPVPAADAGLQPCDVGAHHVAILVEDIAAAHRALATAGVVFTHAPQEVDAGYFRGHRTAYCFDPDGQIVELWQTA